MKNFSRKKIICFSLVFCFLLLLPLFAMLKNPALAGSPLDGADKSVVCVYAENIEGELLGYGTGFLIGDEEPLEYVVTSWLMVNPDEYNLPGAQTLRIMVRVSRDDSRPAEVVQSLKGSDIALLQIYPQHKLYNYPPMVLSEGDTFTSGEEVFAISFAGENIEDFDSAYPENVTTNKGIISKETTWNNVSVYETDQLAVNRAASGGPLLNDRGHVIGINSFQMLASDGINGAVQIDELTALLNTRGISYLSAGDDFPGYSEWITDNYVIVGAGALIIILIIVLIIISSRKKRDSSMKEVIQENEPPLVEGPPQKAESLNNGSGEKKPATEIPVLIGITGYYEGQKIELTENQISIGRDPRMAKLLYPQSNDEISRKHCVIRFDERTRKFILEDTSTNGTFLSSNERLEPQKPYYLNPGERFYLGVPVETFELNLNVERVK